MSLLPFLAHLEQVTQAQRWVAHPFGWEVSAHLPGRHQPSASAEAQLMEKLQNRLPAWVQMRGEISNKTLLLRLQIPAEWGQVSREKISPAQALTNNNSRGSEQFFRENVVPHAAADSFADALEIIAQDIADAMPAWAEKAPRNVSEILFAGDSQAISWTEITATCDPGTVAWILLSSRSRPGRTHSSSYSLNFWASYSRKNPAVRLRRLYARLQVLAAANDLTGNNAPRASAVSAGKCDSAQPPALPSTSIVLPALVTAVPVLATLRLPVTRPGALAALQWADATMASLESTPTLPSLPPRVHAPLRTIASSVLQAVGWPLQSPF